MKKRRALKPMFSLKKRHGDRPADPIILAWREINRSPRPPVLMQEARIAMLACKFPPFIGVDPSNDPRPDGIDARIDELHAYLEQAGELNPDELLLEDVQPFVHEMHEVSVSDEALGGRVVSPANEATLGPKADELQRRAWDIVNREFPDVLPARIINAVRLLYLAVASSADTSSVHDPREYLMGDLHQAFCTWLVEHRDVLTDAEWEELLAFQTPVAQA